MLRVYCRDAELFVGNVAKCARLCDGRFLLRELQSRDILRETEFDRCCSLIPGFGVKLCVKLSITILAGSTVLSAVGSCPPHDGVRRRWWINVESAVALSSARQASSDLTTATVPAGTSFPACVAGTL